MRELLEKLSYAQREKLPPSDFVFPDEDGKGGRWPIQSARQAMIAVDFMKRGRGKKAEYPQIKKAIEKKYGKNKKVMDALAAL